MIILKIKPAPTSGVHALADVCRKFFPAESTLVSTGIITVVGDTSLVCLKLNQDNLTDEQRDWLHLSDFAGHIGSFEVDTNPVDIETQPTLDPWKNLKREVTELRERVSKLEGNTTIPPQSQQPAIDADQLRSMVYIAETSIQNAIDALSPIHRDSTLSQVMMDLGKAMNAMLDIREMLPEEEA